MITPSAVPSTGAINASPAGRLPKDPGLSYIPVSALARLCSSENLMSVPASEITCASDALERTSAKMLLSSSLFYIIFSYF